MKRFNLALMSVFLVQASSVQAALRPASTEDIIAATNACLMMSEKTPADIAVVNALGWQAATPSSKDGQPIDFGMTILGHSKNRSLLMVLEGNCSVTARLKKLSDFGVTVSQLRAQVVPEKEVPQDGGVVMIKGRQLYLIRPTGSPQSPSIAITTMLTRQAPK